MGRNSFRISTRTKSTDSKVQFVGNHQKPGSPATKEGQRTTHLSLPQLLHALVVGHVTLQVARLRELFPTLHALVRFDSGVLARVSVHIATRFEALLALGALVGALRAVRALVNLQRQVRSLSTTSVSRINSSAVLSTMRSPSHTRVGWSWIHSSGDPGV